MWKIRYVQVLIRFNLSMKAESRQIAENLANGLNFVLSLCYIPFPTSLQRTVMFKTANVFASCLFLNSDAIQLGEDE